MNGRQAMTTGAWLKARQEEVMAMTGLTGPYERLTDTQKGVCCRCRADAGLDRREI